VLCAIKDSKHRSFYALWKITKLFGGIKVPRSPWILIIVASHDDACSIRASCSLLLSERFAIIFCLIQVIHLCEYELQIKVEK